MPEVQKTFLLSLDGWGVSSKTDGNATFHAKTPVMDALSKAKDQYAELNASELYVGLPEGVMGNSEVGHLTMGAGREINTDLVRINMDLKNGTFGKNERILEAFKIAKEGNKKLHFLGLLSDAGVHSHIKHLFALLECAKTNKVKDAFVHAFMDGRDTSPNSGAGYIKQLMDFMEKIQYGKLSTMVGRFYAMDRDKRWDRIQVAYDLLVKGEGEQVGKDYAGIEQSLKSKYEKGIFDEMMEPMCVLPPEEGKIGNEDVLVFIDFRSDRMREIVETFGVKFPIDLPNIANNLSIFQMTEYSSSFDLPIIYPPIYIKNVLAELLANNGLNQFHIAETEKYAHVTFFFNGRNESVYKNEERELVPSPQVKTYDLKPEMSMPLVKDGVIKAMKKGYSFIMSNFAPPDMVGHTGNFEATVKACEATDACIGECIKAAKENGYVMIVTSDHGNAEEMLDDAGKPKTSHNCNLVPFALISPPGIEAIKIKGVPTSSLKDVAPTICEIMKIGIPKDMTGKSLIA